MKRILVIDRSPAVRESVAILLERDYGVEQRDALLDADVLADGAARAELVISSAGAESWTPELARLAARLDLAVLLLAESEAVNRSLALQRNLECLVKPFNPYELRTTVERLLSERSHKAPAPAHTAPVSYLEFPFVSHAAARLARRFAALSLPVLIWGERGCGQDRIARAMLAQAPHGGRFLSLNGVDIAADYLQHQQAQLAALRSSGGASPAVLIEGLERLAPSAQSQLLNFLDAIEATHRGVRLLATANEDLLERVYRGDFLERLYYRLAKLTVPLAPLRDRRADLPALARKLAEYYLSELGLFEIDFTPAALARLSDYLWFGNLDEFEMVIARTLAIHGNGPIGATDIVFDPAALVNDAAGKPAPVESSEASVPKSSMIPPGDSPAANAPHGMAGRSPNLRLLVHELAHELKNPMVTIKTFAQLLADRYDDASFRTRFQDVVDGDIGRMDELLGVMTEYAGFDQPRRISIAFVEHLNSTLETIHDECAKRQVQVDWKGNGHDVKIMADAAQLRYALKNTLLAVLSQTKTGSEIELDLAESGALAISYLREGERMRSLDNYFNDGDLPATTNIVPLRIILAREIVERSGGRFDIDEVDADRDIVTMEFPIV